MLLAAPISASKKRTAPARVNGTIPRPTNVGLAPATVGNAQPMARAVSNVPILSNCLKQMALKRVSLPIVKLELIGMRPVPRAQTVQRDALNVSMALLAPFVRTHRSTAKVVSDTT